MASTKRGLAFKGQFWIYDLPAVAGKAIASLSNTKPVIANALAHGLKTGDGIWIESETNSGINGYYLVDVSNEDTFAVIGLNGEDIGTVTDAKFAALECYMLCNVTDLKVDDLKTKENDDSTICDAGAHTSTSKDSGAISVSGIWNPDIKAQEILDELIQTTETLLFAYKPEKSTLKFGYQVVITNSSKQAKATEDWKFSMDGKINGTIRQVRVKADNQPTTKRGAK
ncbi:hypothetical protein [Snodgrassella alvi]|uniref:hypothetical protein n=1 Tax=Snodgrassella alvi TaxID=1196083 RepID=UPI003460B830